ncbi:hypothetical protein SDRG_02929 [Saprolegnia diclina VS20]|uniref:ACT domain-containing protein n=1 Tax=Saprolegnia diclina (strain VS20) TaxID=1156394 RepID=T0R0J5_SAPDV|nr:hypothetical protein SDRG_02929 [Saprolegnia diclina VS20]XP_008621087.1 hypothetical protein SDRG_16649 [Saprolegnia diclina VS20]EQC25478.1 hypothetical protein SDRG_16649 [Saprolegnia diclina VS20]EQC39488.1 hypothetical protein SDRG_02929 [Saprolegnia diclina VS20]|eukprot:XP_008606760.1 hypothetical protein SDRG_02929 [Saprolegnia diclina VS20]
MQRRSAFGRHLASFVRGFCALPSASKEEERYFSLLVINRAGVLGQVATAFARHDANITSLTARPTHVPELSRMNISAILSAHKANRILRNLQRIVSVPFFHVTTAQQLLLDDACLVQSQALFRLSIPEAALSPVHKLIEAYNGSIVMKNEPSLLTPLTTAPSAKDAHNTLVHVVNAPHLLNSFLHELEVLGTTVLECQTSGPCFLDIYTQSTLVAKPVVEHPLEPNGTSSSSSGPHTYSKERQRLHARIAAQLYFHPHLPSKLASPKFILLLGIPGSGKTSILSELDQTGRIVLNDFVNFDVDDITALLPEFYQAMLNIGLGNFAEAPPPGLSMDPHVRYSHCQEEAKFILNSNLAHAMHERMNIILHGSGRSLDTYRSLLDSLDPSYEIHVMCVDVPIEMALDRVEARSRGYGRNVPREIVEGAATQILPHFRTLAEAAPNAHIFDSSTWPPALIWSKQGHEIVYHSKTHPVQEKYGL